MKKSDLVQKMVELIIDNDWFQHDGMYIGSEKMLDMLTSQGMLPPECEDWMGLDECREFYGEDYQTGDIWNQPRKNVNRWGSEE